MGELHAATLRSIDSCEHLTDEDSGAIAVLLSLALKIDCQADYFEALAADAVETGRRPPSMDNVSIPTYLKYCESLGLTPSGRERLKPKKPVEPEQSTLSKLRAQAAS